MRFREATISCYRYLTKARRQYRILVRRQFPAGKGIDRAFENAAAAIEKGFADIDRIVDTNKASLAKLQEEYKRLSSEAAKAFSEARDADYRRYTEAAKNIQSEITLREKLINEAQASADQLLQEEKALKKQKEAAEKNVSTQISLRTQLRNVREELALLEANGQRGTEAFKKCSRKPDGITEAIGDCYDTSAYILP